MVNLKLDSVNLRFDTMAANIAANHSQVMNLLDLDKRLARLEQNAKRESPTQ